MIGAKLSAAILLLGLLSHAVEAGLFGRSNRRAQPMPQPHHPQPAIVNHVHSSNINGQAMDVDGRLLEHGRAHHGYPSNGGHYSHDPFAYDMGGHHGHHGHNVGHGHGFERPAGGGAASAAASASAGGAAAAAASAAGGASGGGLMGGMGGHHHRVQRPHYHSGYPPCAAPPCYGGMGPY